MYINKRMDENEINKQIINKINNLLKYENVTIAQIFFYMFQKNIDLFKIIFGKLLIAYFEEIHKSYTKEEIINAKEEDFFRILTLEEFFDQNEDLKNDFHNDFEKYKKATKKEKEKK